MSTVRLDYESRPRPSRTSALARLSCGSMVVTFIALFVFGFAAPAIGNVGSTADLVASVLVVAMPVLALISGFAALRRISESQGRLIGSTQAWTGIALAIIWIGLGVVGSLFRA